MFKIELLRCGPVRRCRLRQAGLAQATVRLSPTPAPLCPPPGCLTVGRNISTLDRVQARPPFVASSLRCLAARRLRPPRLGKRGSPMIPGRMIRVVLLCFVIGLIASAAGELLDLSVDPVASAHAHGVAHSHACPDPEQDGSPCGPACPCTCCPGHSVPAAVVYADRPSLLIPPAAQLQAVPPRDLHPEDVLRRIFHPPRA